MVKKNIIIYLLESGIFQCFLPAVSVCFSFDCFCCCRARSRRHRVIVSGRFSHGIHKLYYIEDRMYANESLVKILNCAPNEQRDGE